MQRINCEFYGFLQNRFANAVTSSKIAGFRLDMGIASPGVRRWLIRVVTKDDTLYKTVRSCYSSQMHSPGSLLAQMHSPGSLLAPRNIRPCVREVTVHR
jgi:hypothetical protein